MTFFTRKYAFILELGFLSFNLLLKDPIICADPMVDFSDQGVVRTYRCKVVHAFPHDPNAFTQGLVYHHGFLYESTGLLGESSLRKVEIDTGHVLQCFRLPARYFGEGLTIWQDRLIQLTWTSRTGFVYDLNSFQLIKQFSYPTEGWGLTCNGSSLILSDGTSRLHFLDPESYAPKGQLNVVDRGRPVELLNELEYINGEIYANVWQTNRIARISAKSGQVVGWINLEGLPFEGTEVHPADVPNGIAYDRSNDRLFLTGKFWPKLFEVKLLLE